MRAARTVPKPQVVLDRHGVRYLLVPWSTGVGRVTWNKRFYDLLEWDDEARCTVYIDANQKWAHDERIRVALVSQGM